jgi:hypothetical protein
LVVTLSKEFAVGQALFVPSGTPNADDVFSDKTSAKVADETLPVSDGGKSA